MFWLKVRNEVHIWPGGWGLGCMCMWFYLMESAAWGLNIMLTSVVFGLLTCESWDFKWRSVEFQVSLWKPQQHFDPAVIPALTAWSLWAGALVVSSFAGLHAVWLPWRPHVHLQSPWSRGGVSGIHFLIPSCLCTFLSSSLALLGFCNPWFMLGTWCKCSYCF